MIIYDYRKDISLSSILFCLIAVICVCSLISLIVFGIKVFIKNGMSYHIFFLALAVIIVLVLTGFVSFRTYNIVKYNYECKSGNYETVSGTFEIVSITQDNYRDEELYTIDFMVNGVKFYTLANSFSEEQKNKLLTIDEDIEIRYAYIGSELVIYQIVTCIEG